MIAGQNTLMQQNVIELFHSLPLLCPNALLEILEADLEWNVVSTLDSVPLDVMHQ